MSQNSPFERMIWHLEGKLPDNYYPRSVTTPEEALTGLRQFTGVDLGYDGDAWRQWFKENRPDHYIFFTTCPNEFIESYFHTPSDDEPD